MTFLINKSDIALEYLAPLVNVNNFIPLFKGPSYFKNEKEYTQNVLKKLNIAEFKEIEYERRNNSCTRNKEQFHRSGGKDLTI